MKKLHLAASNGLALMMGMVLTLSSCSEEVKNPADETVYAPVRVQVDEFSVSMEDFPQTRAVQTLDEYGYVGAITLAFYDTNGTEVVKTTQLKSDPSQYTTYGQFSFTLPVGSYTLVAVGYGFNDGRHSPARPSAPLSRSPSRVLHRWISPSHSIVSTRMSLYCRPISVLQEPSRSARPSERAARPLVLRRDSLLTTSVSRCRTR